MSALLGNVALAVAWAVMTGAFTVMNLMLGLVLGAVALALVRDRSQVSAEWRRMLFALDLAAVFLWELLKSTAVVARIVLSTRSPRPAIVAYPLAVTSDTAITLLANMITLTPGTLTIDVSDDRTTLFVHALDAPDPEAVIEGIRMSFERRLARIFA